ncbi:MAG TPA: laccase domain-containing protein [bacterium]|nr:laccase domain-containing protein [bacterium]
MSLIRVGLGLSTVSDGNMRLADVGGIENRQRLLAKYGFNYDQQAASAGLRHETNVVVIDEQRGCIPDCDALVTKQTGAVLCLGAGDCAPPN